MLPLFLGREVVGGMHLTWGVLSSTTGGSMVVAAASEAVIGAAATIVVGFLAAASAVGVAWIQSRNSGTRDRAAQEMIELARKLSEVEHERAQALSAELNRLRKNETGEPDATPTG